MARETSVVLTFRAPKSMEAALDHMAVELARDRSECIREAVAQYIESGPNSLQRRVSLLEQRVAQLDRAVGLDATISPSRPSEAIDNRVRELEAKLAVAEAEAASSRSEVETLEAIINQGGGSSNLLQWLVEFRKKHPPK